jgi:alpha-glucuronidase
VTLAQHVYDSHYAGAEAVRSFIARWEGLGDRVDPVRHAAVARRVHAQLESAERWRDVINAYFHRLSGIPDAHGRPLY